MMNIEHETIAIVGLGYVGLPLAVAFGKHRAVIGFDTDARRIEELVSGLDRTLETDSGELETGILQSESAEAVTLLQAQGKKVVIPRRRIKRLEASGLSLMPEGLEAGMTAAELRDLIAFLQERR